MLYEQENSNATRACAQLTAFPGWEWTINLDLDHYRILPPVDDTEDDLTLSA